MDPIRAELQARLDAFDRLATDSKDLRHAAVAIAVVTSDLGVPAIVMTRRTSRLRDHAGQFAFPGGRLDAGETPSDAARRELHEEVGLDVDATAVMGILDDYVTRSGYVMTPVVLWAGRQQERDLAPNAGEVEDAFVVPLADLDHAPNVYAIPESPRLVINVPFRDTVLHAPSGAIMHQFAEIALRGRVTRVADFDQPVFAWGNRKEPPPKG